ncbi:MAG: L-rhamnonate dehydratase [Bryobacterales bacterium]|nr:L-rhamnonate dehydratase [Bryobacterales bacterium]
MTRRVFTAASSISLVPITPALRITSVKAVPVPLLSTARFGSSQFSSDDDPARYRWFGPFSQLAGSILVEIKTDQGITGLGLGGGGGAACYIIDNHLKDLLLGANALNIHQLWDQIFASTSFYGRKGLPIMALSGIDLALWDIAGKRHNVPCWQLLGGKRRDRVRAYFTGPGIDLGLKLGFTAFKQPINLGPADGQDGKFKIAAQLKAVREKIGPDNLLMIDVLCRWNVDYTVEMADRLAPYNLYFIEEPLLPDDLRGYEKLCQKIKSTKIASGEHEFTHYGFDLLIRHRASHFLQPDLTWGGGLTMGQRILNSAAEAGIPILPHRGGSLFGMQLVTACDNCPMAESFGTGEPGNELMELFTAPFEHGSYLPPTQPGVGVTIPDTLARKYGL